MNRRKLLGVLGATAAGLTAMSRKLRGVLGATAAGLTAQTPGADPGGSGAQEVQAGLREGRQAERPGGP